jgi:hypothetical protein
LVSAVSGCARLPATSTGSVMAEGRCAKSDLCGWRLHVVPVQSGTSALGPSQCAPLSVFGIDGPSVPSLATVTNVVGRHT